MFVWGGGWVHPSAWVGLPMAETWAPWRQTVMEVACSVTAFGSSCGMDDWGCRGVAGVPRWCTLWVSPSC